MKKGKGNPFIFSKGKVLVPFFFSKGKWDIYDIQISWVGGTHSFSGTGYRGNLFINDGGYPLIFLEREDGFIYII